MNFLKKLQLRREMNKRTRQPGKEQKGTFHPRKLYRGLTVPWSNAPGRSRIHPKKAKGERAT